MTEKHLANNFQVNRIFYQTPIINTTSMSNDVYCKCDTINIVNTDYKRENNEGTENVMSIMKLTVLNVKHLVLIGRKTLFTQP